MLVDLTKKELQTLCEFIAYNNDGMDYVVFRTGEMYLNGAEAAFEITDNNR